MIRPEYVEQLKKQREANPAWGGSAVRNAGDHVVRYIQRHPAIKTVLDFGSGVGTLKRYVEQNVVRPMDNPVSITEYDPSVPGKDVTPTATFDLIITTDVLEHVERESLDETLDWIAEHSRRQFHHIDCNNTNHILPDGRDVHLIVRPPHWWESYLNREGWTQTYAASIRQRKRSRERHSCTFIYERC